MLSLIMPTAKGQFPQLVHLNKDDIDWYDRWTTIKTWT
jgi:hypothetical protein